MKKSITFLLLTAVCTYSPVVNDDGLDQYQQETNQIWSPTDEGTKDTSQDGQIAKSMLAWGLGLAVVIGIVFGLIKSYQSSSTTTQ
jgi:hypothetical protein